MTSVSVNGSGPAFQAGAPQELFESLEPYTGLADGPFRVYAVSPGRQQLLIRRPARDIERGSSSPITVVLNWPES